MILIKSFILEKLIIIYLVVLTLLSCNSKIPLPPKEKCESVSLKNLPVITHGFKYKIYDSVVVRAYFKNSHFDTLLKQFKLPLGIMQDPLRYQRNFSLPQSITTNYDLMFVFNDTLKYTVTKMKTDWIPRWGQSFVGYSCSLTTFTISDTINEYNCNITLDEPNYKFRGK